MAATPVTHGNARKRARKHVRGEGEVWRQRLIAGAQVSKQSPWVGAQWSCTRVLLLPKPLLPDHGWPLVGLEQVPQIPVLRLLRCLFFGRLFEVPRGVVNGD